MRTLKGQLLIATPGLNAPFFTRSVILMLEHNEDGAAGIVLNRPTETTVAEIAEEVFDEALDWDKTLLLGGPVPGPLMVIHQDESLADREIIAGVFNSVEASKVREAIFGRPDPSLVVANYAGWGPGQLEGEFDLDSWLTLPATLETIFWAGTDDLWNATVKRVNAQKLSDFLGLGTIPADPSLN
ncbi:YqgE/AlgH family protein [Tundrisphaera sp. TA3]|uniref:YqgE/AlgH family protein n=1 Tax=Tundrisphaera sp. TA3 TaxID=3435775 RepID=UPI003EBB9064